MTENDNSVRLTRRNMLIKLGKLGAAGAVAAAGTSGAIKVITEADKILSRPLLEKIPTPPLETTVTAPKPTETVKPTPTITENNSPAADRPSRKEFLINFGEEKRVTLELDWAPDTHTSMLKVKDEFWIFISSAGTSYLVKTDNFEEMANPIKLLEPDNAEHENGFIGYTGVGSVIPGRNPNENIMFFHQETWGVKNSEENYLAEICLAISKDNCRTWENKGPIITGKEPGIPGKVGASGAGQPCAIVFNNEVYLFYIDWNHQEANAINVAKVPLSGVENKGLWQKFNGNGFSIPGETHESFPVISPDKAKGRLDYCALPDISYNQYLNCWLALFEATDGFYTCTSTDLLHWENYQPVFPFPKRRSEEQPGDTWYSYPTLLSLDTSSDRITNQNGILVYSKGARGGRHNMYFSTFHLT